MESLRPLVGASRREARVIREQLRETNVVNYFDEYRLQWRNHLEGMKESQK
jgi:hypothetical protein